MTFARTHSLLLVVAVGLASTLASCRPPPGPLSADGSRRDARLADVRSRDARADRKADRAADLGRADRALADTLSPDVPCGTASGPASLYEAYCSTSVSGICFFDHPPSDF